MTDTVSAAPKSRKPRIPALPDGSYFYLNEDDRIEFCAEIRRIQLELTRPENSAHGGDRGNGKSRQAPIVVEQLKAHVFPEDIFTGEAIGSLFKTLWFQHFVPSDPRRTIRKIFEESLLLREFVFCNGRIFVRNHRGFRMEWISQLCLGLAGVLDFDELTVFLDRLGNYPRLWSVNVFILMVVPISDPINFTAITPVLWQAGQGFPSTGLDFYFQAWDRFGAFDKVFWNSLDQGTIHPENFVIDDSRVLEKFQITDSYGIQGSGDQTFGFKKGLSEFIQVGIFLQALKDGVENLSIETLCAVYGVC